MGIPLLTPDRIKRDRQEDFNVTQRRSILLAEEETRVVSSLNLTRDAADEQRGEIALELQMYEHQADDRKKAIDEEIHSKEVQRDAIIPALHRREEEVSARETAAAIRENKAKKDSEKLVSRETSVKVRENAVDEREKMLETRENALVPNEAAQNDRRRRLETQMQDVEADKLAHQANVRAFNEQAANIKSKNDANALANANEKARLEEKDRNYQQKDREIADRYATLTAASEEVNAMRRDAGLPEV